MSDLTHLSLGVNEDRMTLDEENADLRRKLEIARVLLNATMGEQVCVMLTQSVMRRAAANSNDFTSKVARYGIERFYLSLDESRSDISHEEMLRRCRLLDGNPETPSPKALPEPFIDAEVVP